MFVQGDKDASFFLQGRIEYFLPADWSLHGQTKPFSNGLPGQSDKDISLLFIEHVFLRSELVHSVISCRNCLAKEPFSTLLQLRSLSI
jgi:hypothetical protein